MYSVEAVLDEEKTVGDIVVKQLKIVVKQNGVEVNDSNISFAFYTDSFGGYEYISLLQEEENVNSLADGIVYVATYRKIVNGILNAPETIRINDKNKEEIGMFVKTIDDPNDEQEVAMPTVDGEDIPNVTEGAQIPEVTGNEDAPIVTGETDESQFPVIGGVDESQVPVVGQEEESQAPVVGTA